MSRRFLLALPILLAASTAFAQQETTTSSTFDSWVMGCTTRTDKDNKTVKGCEIRSTLVVRDQKTNQDGVAAVIAIGRLTSDKALQATVQLPIAAVLNVPVKVTGADDKPIFELSYVACQPQMCSATTTLTDPQVAALRKIGEKLFIVYRNQAGQDVKIDAATKGLNAALDALLKEK